MHEHDEYYKSLLQNTGNIKLNITFYIYDPFRYIKRTSVLAEFSHDWF